MMQFTFNFARLARREARPILHPPHRPTWQQQVLAKGWATPRSRPPAFRRTMVRALNSGIIGPLHLGQPRKPMTWCLAAWAWVPAVRWIYFESDKAVDAKHVGIEALRAKARPRW